MTIKLKALLTGLVLRKIYNSFSLMPDVLDVHYLAQLSFSHRYKVPQKLLHLHPGIAKYVNALALSPSSSK